MSTKTVKILYRHPNKVVRVNAPKVLEWDDHKKERHFFEPSSVQGKVVYELPEAYARLLLSRQPERYYLLEPKKLLCRFPSQDGMSYQMKEVLSVQGTKKFAEFSSEAEAEEKARQSALKTVDEEADDIDQAEKEEAARLEKEKADKAAKGQQNPPKGNQPVPPANGPQGAPQGSGAL